MEQGRQVSRERERRRAQTIIDTRASAAKKTKHVGQAVAFRNCLSLALGAYGFYGKARTKLTHFDFHEIFMTSWLTLTTQECGTREELRGIERDKSTLSPRFLHAISMPHLHLYFRAHSPKRNLGNSDLNTGCWWWKNEFFLCALSDGRV